MHRLTTLSLRALVFLSLVAPVLPGSSTAAAQSGCGPMSNAIQLAVGVAQSDRLDATASPLQFGGRGGEAIVGFDHSVGGLCLLTGARGGQRTLSATTGTSGSERLIDADARIALLKGFGTSESRNWFAAGLEVGANVAATSHRYTDPNRSISNYRMGFASVGPSALWRLRIGRDAATVQLSSPLVALVDHPYSAVWTNDAMPKPRAATIASLRGVNGTISYSFAPNRRVSTVATYGFAAMRYDDVRPVRALTQTLSVGMRLRLSPERK